MPREELHQKAKELYDANGGRSYGPPWEQLGDVTKSVWLERVQASNKS
jgi:hypothetical protein